MKSYRYPLFILMLLITVLACRKESSIADIETNIPGPEIFIESEVIGLVSSPNGSPIENAQVFWGTATTLTDQNGFFKLRSTVPEKIAVLNIKKENYFESHQTLSAIKEESIRTTVQLIERTLSGSISTSNGGIIEINGGGKVDFAANGFIDESGTEYTGQVNVYTTYLDPTIDNLQQIMPGNLAALNTDGILQTLKSFGMINVELEGNDGQKLQINQAATLTTPVPADLIDTAPNRIPLWHFDTESGLWIEEGEALLQGDEYIGEVTHFSWWNCDDNIDVVYLQGQVIDVDVPANVDIRITRPDGSTGVITTSSNGNFGGFVPKDEVLTFEIVDVCNNVVYSEEIGPFTIDNQYFQITVVLPDVNLSNISGTAINCDGLPVSNGYILVNGIDGDLFFLIPTETDGNFSSSFYACDAQTVSIIAADVDEATQSIPSVLIIEENMDVEFINACDVAIASIEILKDGIMEAFYAPCITTLIQNGMGNPVYEISYQSVQDNGSVSYFLNIQDENNNPDDPSYSYVYGANPTDFPEIRYPSLSILNTNSITKLSSNESLGDIVHFYIDDLILTKQTINVVTGEIIEEVLNDCTIEIKATLVQ